MKTFPKTPLFFITIGVTFILLSHLSGCAFIKDLTYNFGPADWYPSLDAAFEAGGKKPVLLFVHSEYECKYCQELISRFLQKKDFVELVRNYRPVHYNIHDIQEMKEGRIKQYRINVHHAFVVFNNKGKIIDKVIGYNPKGIFDLLERHSGRQVNDLLY